MLQLKFLARDLKHFHELYKKIENLFNWLILFLKMDIWMNMTKHRKLKRLFVLLK